MNILAIMGSPHKGESLKATQRFEQKMKEFGDVEFDYLHLKDINLKPCRGCFVCFLKGKEYCTIEDDKEQIEERINKADGVIFVSPVYSMHISYLLKTFIDRFAYTFHRPMYMDKYAIGIVTTGGLGLDETLKYIKGIAVCWGFYYIDSLGLITPPKPIPMLLPHKDRTDEVAEKFYTAINEKKQRRLSITDSLHFRAMQAVYEKLEKYSPTDYAYWKDRGWLDPKARYFTDAKINIFKEFIAKIMTGMMDSKMKKSLKRAEVN